MKYIDTMDKSKSYEENCENIAFRNDIGTMQVPEGDLDCQYKLSIF